MLVFVEHLILKKTKPKSPSGKLRTSSRYKGFMQHQPFKEISESSFLIHQVDAVAHSYMKKCNSVNSEGRVGFYIQQ